MSKNITSGYGRRKVAQANGHPPKSRMGEGMPWYTWPIGVAATEAKMNKDLERTVRKQREREEYKALMASLKVP